MIEFITLILFHNLAFMSVYHFVLLTNLYLLICLFCLKWDLMVVL